MKQHEIIQCPAIELTLLKYLEQAFPDKLPDNILTISDRELGALVGRQMVIRHLAELLTVQEEDKYVP